MQARVRLGTLRHSPSPARIHQHLLAGHCKLATFFLSASILWFEIGQTKVDLAHHRSTAIRFFHDSTPLNASQRHKVQCRPLLHRTPPHQPLRQVTQRRQPPPPGRLRPGPGPQPPGRRRRPQADFWLLSSSSCSSSSSSSPFSRSLASSSSRITPTSPSSNSFSGTPMASSEGVLSLLGSFSGFSFAGTPTPDDSWFCPVAGFSFSVSFSPRKFWTSLCTGTQSVKRSTTETSFMSLTVWRTCPRNGAFEPFINCSESFLRENGFPTHKCYKLSVTTSQNHQKLRYSFSVASRLTHPSRVVTVNFDLDGANLNNQPLWLGGWSLHKALQTCSQPKKNDFC